MPEAARFEELCPAPESLAIDRRSVAHLARCGPAGRWTSALEEAIDEARSLIAPVARWLGLPGPTARGLFPAPTPVEEVALRGERWAYVATVGPALETRVEEHFAQGRFLEGVLLDAAGSTAVEAVGSEVEKACSQGKSTSRFSPGYCGWELGGQRRLFDLLRPEERGIRLLSSLLMHPLKSVSGIVVQAAPEDLRVPPEACQICEARGCTRRRAQRRSHECQ